jgi:hypothetical protein
MSRAHAGALCGADRGRGAVREDGVNNTASDPGHPLAVRFLDRLIDGGQDATRGFHTLTFHMTLRPGISGADARRCPVGSVVASAQFQQLNVKAWLIRRI